MKKKIILSIISVILTTFCLITLTYSWFATNTKTDSSGMQIGVKGGEDIFIEECHIYKRNQENNAIEEVSNNVLDDPLYNKPISLNPYDTIIKERNVGTHIVISILVKNIQLGKTINITAFSNNPISEEDKYEPLSNYLSNICGFRCRCGEEDDTIEAAFGSFTNEEIQDFVSVDSASDGTHLWQNTKASTLTMTLADYDDKAFLVEGDTNKRLRVYIEISYDEELVSAYLEQSGSSTDFGSVFTSEIHFINDLLPFLFEYSN
ncbi:MAG: hypothetical protein J6W64_05375 [Bacilli bacterium]|nr:hypothetical protein [Bacilli bacterium]